MNQHQHPADAPHKPSARESAAITRHRRAQRIRELEHDPRFDRLRTPIMRRSLVAAGYALMVGSAAIAWVDPPSLMSVAAPLSFLAGLGVAFVLSRVVRHAVDANDDALDERLIALRNQAFHRTYPILALSLLGALIALMIGLGDATEQRHLQSLFYAYGLAVVMTPLASLTWNGDAL